MSNVSQQCSGNIRVATYNIRRCIGVDHQRDSSRIVTVLQEIGADVFALQEVDSTVGEIRDFAAHLSSTFSCQAIAGPTFVRDDIPYGNLLLTRLPVQSVKLLDLSVHGREPRGAIVATLLAGDSPVLVVATHLGLNPAERRRQVRQLLTEVFQEMLPPAASVRMLLGDLNEWFLWGRPMRWLRVLFGKAPALRTFPVGFPLFALDRIWVQPQHLRRSLHVHRSKPSRVASDHLPLVACIDVPSYKTTKAQADARY